MAFLETPRFPDCISYGSAGGPEYSTSIIVLGSGQEKRNQNWALPRHYFDVAYGVKRQSDMEDLIDFFNAVKGPANGFRFKNFLDMSSGHTDEATSFTDQTIGTGDGSTTTFQLVKNYTQGAITQTNNITKPVSGTVTIGLNGVQQMAGFTVDTTTGIVTFSGAPGGGVTITAGYEYDLPVRFESDRLTVSITSYLAGEASVRVVEIR